MSSIDNVMKNKLGDYNLAKGTLVQLQRKKQYVYSIVSHYLPLTDGSTHSGNLSVRSLVDVVPRDVFVQDSEYLETLLVVVPK